MLGWLGVNACLLTVSLICAGQFFALFSLVRVLGVSPDVERYLGTVAAVIALVGTYFATKWLHALLERLVNRRTRASRASASAGAATQAPIRS